MSGNTFGAFLRLTTFGESHGPAIGGVLDGFPSGIPIDEDFIRKEMARRRPGQSSITTRRDEEDQVEILSGVYQGKSTGAPIGFIIRNTDQRPADYDQNVNLYRPSHADYTWDKKFGFRDPRGGGRSSARETAARVAAAAFAKQFLSQHGVLFKAWVSQVGHIQLDKPYSDLNLDLIESNEVRCPDNDIAQQMIGHIKEIRKQGDTVGGVITGIIKKVPAGLGEPVFDKLNADLAKAMFSIPAVKGFEIGSGFSGSEMKGSEHNDPFVSDKGKVRTSSNNSGGIQGGISNGEDIFFRVAFKPVSTIMMEQDTVNSQGQPATIKGKGRHDPCVVPRAVPVVEAMAALVIADHWLINTSRKHS